MSCGNPHETDCSEILDHLYEYLDNEMAEGECAKFRVHFDECHPCLEKYGLEAAVKKLVKRCCGSEEAPAELRGKVMGRIQAIRAGGAGSVSSASAQQPAEPGSATAPQATAPQAGATGGAGAGATGSTASGG